MTAMNEELTPKQQEILEFIREAIETTGFPPTRAEIAKAFRYSSPNAAEEQKKSRAMWWDKRPDPEADRARQQSTVTQPAYVYGSPIAKPKR